MELIEFTDQLLAEGDQVFLLTSPLPIPINFATHPWIVTVRDQEIHRWEVWAQQKKQCRSRWGHVHRDLFPPTLGLRRSPLSMKVVGPVKLRGMVEGELAGRMIDFLEAEAPGYRYADTYRYYPGPNSNTFVQWVIDSFPETQWRLPASALGKRYLHSRIFGL